MIEFLQKNKKEILIILGTLVLYFLLSTNYAFSHSPDGYIILFFPGLFSALISAVIWKNIKKALTIGVITNIIWFIGFFILISNFTFI